MKKTITLSILLLMTATLMGCETVKGIAKDIQNTGDNIWEAVNKK